MLCGSHMKRTAKELLIKLCGLEQEKSETGVAVVQAIKKVKFSIYSNFFFHMR